MSVYTPVAKDELEKIVDTYALGRLRSYDGITEGVTNTIYKLETDEGDYILTVFETLKSKELPFFTDLMQYLNDQGLSCQHPIKDRHGENVGEIYEKPYILSPYLEGAPVTKPNEAQCHAAGQWLAKMHRLGQKVTARPKNTRGIQWCFKSYDQLKDRLSHPQQRLIESELKRHARINYKALPQGIIHGDLFRDNVIFKEEELASVIDFYFACWDTLMIDLANVINDWCLSQRAEAQTLVNASIEGYNSIRKTDVAERRLFQEALCFTSLRYWLSRLQDSFRYEASDTIQVKDPREYEILLNLHRSRLG